jgi:hypothetical protein
MCGATRLVMCSYISGPSHAISRAQLAPALEADGRIIINREEAITWVTLHEEAKASREALKTQRLYGNSTRLNSIAAQLNLSLARQAASI